MTRSTLRRMVLLTTAGVAACSPSGGLPPPECVALDPSCARNQASVVVEVRGIPRNAARVWAAAGDQERAVTGVPDDGSVTFYFFDVPSDAPVAAGTGERTQGRSCALGNHRGDREHLRVDLSTEAARCQDVGGAPDAGAADAGLPRDAGPNVDAGDDDDDGGHDDDEDAGNRDSGGDGDDDGGGDEPEDDGGRQDSGR